MNNCDEVQWIQERINKTRDLIVKYEEAIFALSMTGIQSYQLDTGQTRQLVTRSSVGSLKETLSWLETRLSTYQQQLCGGSIKNMRPAW